MLAGHGAAHGHAGLQNVGTKQLAAVQLIGVARVKQNQRMQIAVARMKHIAAAQLVFLFHLGNCQQDVGQALARDGAVHAHVVRADAPRRGEGILASAPKAHALGFAVAHRNRGGTGGGEHRAHAANFFFHLFGCAIALAQQNGGGAQVVTGVHIVFHGGGHGLVHHLQTGRDDALGNHLRHRFTGLAHIIKAGHDAARKHGLGDQLDGDLGGHSQHALAANHDAQKLVAGLIECVAAEGDGFALHGEAAHLLDVVQGQAVFEAMHAARVFRHIAANGAGNLAAGIGRVVQAMA